MTPGDPAAAVVIELAGLRTQFDKFGNDLSEVRTATAVPPPARLASAGPG
ncbi:hypothetical protein ACWGQ5_17375 [Streptomyces sp. NPDC055722]